MSFEVKIRLRHQEIRKAMSEGHPDPNLLECFLRNEVEASACRRIVRHLLTGCPQCIAVTRRFWSFGGLGEGPRRRTRLLAGSPKARSPVLR
jgi:hypothetical protein